MVAGGGDGFQAGVKTDADLRGAVAVVAQGDTDLHLSGSFEDCGQRVRGAEAPARGGGVHVEQRASLAHGFERSLDLEPRALVKARVLSSELPNQVEVTDDGRTKLAHHLCQLLEVGSVQGGHSSDVRRGLPVPLLGHVYRHVPHVVDAADRVVEVCRAQLVHPVEPTLWRHHLGLKADEHLESSLELSLQGSSAVDIGGEDPRQIRWSQVLLARIEIFRAKTRRVLGHSVDAEASFAGALEHLGQGAVRMSAELAAVSAVEAKPGHARDDTLADMEELWDRILRASKLEPDVYEEVEADQAATPQAALVVVLSAVAAGIGNVVSAGVFGVIVFAIAALIGWYVWAYLTYFIGTRLLPEVQTQADYGQLLRTIGFASAPGMIRVFGIIPGIGGLFFPLAGIWMLIATVIAVRQALDYTSTLRAVGVCLLGWIVYAVIAFIPALLFRL